VKLLITCLLLAVSALADVKIDRKSDQIDVEIDGKPFTTFYFGKDLMKPYLHPLRAADGTIITRQWPMEKEIAGESHDHPHHQGLWIGVNDVSGVQFWENAKPGPNMGRQVLAKITSAKGGSKQGVIECVINWTTPDGKVLLREDRKMTFYSGMPDKRMFDIDAKLTAVNGPVNFGDTKEGFFAIRLNDKLTEKSKGGMMVNAEGAQGMRNVWGKKSAWVDYSGTIDGKPLGIAIIDNKNSFGYPTRWHSRDYGLFAANPIFESEANGGRATKEGKLILEKGKSIDLKHRVLIHAGNTADAKIADEAAKYNK
jgi:hypothetical protein